MISKALRKIIGNNQNVYTIPVFSIKNSFNGIIWELMIVDT